MKSAEDIRKHVAEQLLALVEERSAKCDDEPWRTGTQGIMADGKIELLKELEDWMDTKETR